MKHSIEWHKQGLINSTLHAKRKRLKLDRDLDSIKELEQSNGLKKAQIDLAIKEKKDGFDEAKYAIRRLCV
tara:strand:+ start:174 stop:386 length:213 start_codon:yes stop_codon:yes gene_type:complete